jgi:lipopolysaccharide/colanic/teichoic acid biosynthesis glycosyltransferase
MQRAIDLLFSITMLVILSPLFLVTGLLIRLESPGEAFFKQERLGKQKDLFQIYKFRTMTKAPPGTEVRLATTTDSRVTRFGWFLRASKIDELPQLINVLKGEMTLIGPRAETPNFLPYFSQEERQVFSVKPGLTGPGQIHYTTHQAARLEEGGDSNKLYIEEILPEKLAIDLEYIRNRTLSGDLVIMARTIMVVLSLGRKG